jgi:hypothetical protein
MIDRYHCILISLTVRDGNGLIPVVHVTVVEEPVVAIRIPSGVGVVAATRPAVEAVNEQISCLSV